MDGTLVDSSDYHWRSWRDTLASEGFALSYEQFTASFGQRNDTILRGYFGPDFPQSEIDRIGDAKEAIYRQLVRTEGLTLLPGVGAWLRRLHQAGWRQAIASAAPRANVETILEVLQIGPFIEAIVSAEDVQRGKPDPQVFLLAAERVAVPPAHSIVVEDAPAGLEGARRAGMRCIGVRTSHTGLLADIAVDRLDELPPDCFERLLEK
jgi:HAD superfamily hydrolase (TIGR01509 family)